MLQGQFCDMEPSQDDGRAPAVLCNPGQREGTVKTCAVKDRIIKGLLIGPYFNHLNCTCTKFIFSVQIHCCCCNSRKVAAAPVQKGCSLLINHERVLGVISHSLYEPRALARWWICVIRTDFPGRRRTLTCLRVKWRLFLKLVLSSDVTSNRSIHAVRAVCHCALRGADPAAILITRS